MTMLIASLLILSACASQTPDTSASSKVSGTENSLEAENNGVPSDTEKGINHFPVSLATIPDSYLREAEQKGTLQDLYYDTYESFSLPFGGTTCQCLFGLSSKNMICPTKRLFRSLPITEVHRVQAAFLR